MTSKRTLNRREARAFDRVEASLDRLVQAHTAWRARRQQMVAAKLTANVDYMPELRVILKERFDAMDLFVEAHRDWLQAGLARREAA